MRLVPTTLLLLVVAACSSKYYLMPTPTIYTDRSWNPFETVPQELQGNEIPVLYVTDRVPEEKTEGAWKYGYARSRSAAFGEATVAIGEGLSWEEVIEASRTEKRKRKLALRLTRTQELGRFGEVPPRLVLTDAEMAKRGKSGSEAAPVAAEGEFRAYLSRRLAKTPRKEVFIVIHGYANTLEYAVKTTAQIWHFLGREGVPLCYTWPAGPATFKGYEYTLASTQFTVAHLKRTLRRIAACPDVEKIHLLAHSRGTAVATETVRELHLELRSTTDTQKALKLGTAILAAADIDLDVAIARNASERIGQAVEHTILYVSKEDSALGISSWLFGGQRLGKIDFQVFAPEEIAVLRKSTRIQVIDARVEERGAFGHSYFHANPAVSSDVCMALRFGAAPGAEHGRPLEISKEGLWYVSDDYPGKDWTPPDLAGARAEDDGKTR